MKRKDSQYRNFISSIVDQFSTIYTAFDEGEKEHLDTVKDAMARLDYQAMAEDQKKEFEAQYGRLAVLEELNRQRALKIGAVVLILAVVMLSLYFLFKKK